MKLFRFTLGAVSIVAATALVAGVAFADTTIDSGDVAIIDAASASPAVLERTGTSAFKIDVTADDGNIPAAQCDGSKNAATTGNDFAVSSTGLTVGGTTEKITFPCQNFAGSGGTPSTQTFDLEIVAAATAPLGASNYAISFGTTGTNVVLGSQLKLDASFTNPRVYVVVNPRPASSLGATAGVQSVDLGWTASPDAADITDYKIAWTDGTNQGVLTAAKTATTFTHSGLVAGTEYCYTIRSRFDDTGVDRFSSVSNQACATPLAPASNTYSVTFSQPIDGNGVINKGKYGRVIPVKVTLSRNSTVLTDGSGGPLSIGASVSPCSAATSDNIENYSPGSSEHGTEFRWDGTQWIYNLDTSKLPNAEPNKCYTVSVVREGASIGSFQIQLTK